MLLRLLCSFTLMLCCRLSFDMISLKLDLCHNSAIKEIVETTPKSAIAAYL